MKTNPPVYKLIKWYKKNKRALPWRKYQNPYFIWLSEVMLQQSTVHAVIPYYEKFIKRFNTLPSLAKAPLEEVLSYWTGLGYYSRVKNLHKSAKILHKQKYFPKTHKELILLPGFGPYTARAVSSLAFEEKTAVLDANVIRVMSRYTAFQKPWWNTKERNHLQKKADKWVENHSPSLVNQALMELGSLICTAHKPLCINCPISNNCQAFKQSKTHLIPIKKKKKQKEIWLWKPDLYIKNHQVALIKKHNLPFLKNYFMLPGKIIKIKKIPSHYDFTHYITHHVIYVLVHKKKYKPTNSILWVNIKELNKKNPSSLLQKILRPCTTGGTVPRRRLHRLEIRPASEVLSNT